MPHAGLAGRGQGHHVVHTGLLKRAPKIATGVSLPTRYNITTSYHVVLAGSGTR